MTSSAPKLDQDCLGRSLSRLPAAQPLGRLGSVYSNLTNSRYYFLSSATNCVPAQVSTTRQNSFTLQTHSLMTPFLYSSSSGDQFPKLFGGSLLSPSSHVHGADTRQLARGPFLTFMCTSVPLSAPHSISLRTMVFLCIDALLLRPTSLLTDLYSSHATAPLRVFE